MAPPYCSGGNSADDTGISAPPNSQALRRLPVRRAVRVAEQLEPCLLLRFGRHRELAERFRVDVALAVGVQNRIDQLRDRKPPLDEQFGHAELAGDVGDAAPLRREGGEGFVLVDLIHRQARDVLGKRGLDRHGVIAGSSTAHGTGSALPVSCASAWQASRRRCRDHFEAVAVRPHQQGLDDAKAADAGDQVVDILAAVLAHVERRV